MGEIITKVLKISTLIFLEFLKTNWCLRLETSMVNFTKFTSDKNHTNIARNSQVKKK